MYVFVLPTLVLESSAKQVSVKNKQVINTGEQEAISNKVNIGLAYETHLLILS